MNVIAVDLDDTLIDSVAVPICKNIEKHNNLFEDPNNFIVIYTARSYVIYNETRNLLSRYKIKFHALVMEKMRADLYIDDKSRSDFI